MLSELKADQSTDKALEAQAAADAVVEERTVEREVANAADAEAENKPEQKQTMVPHGALHEERMERKRLASELAQMRQAQQQRDQEWQIAQQRMGQMLQRMQPAPPAPPDPTADPLGATLHKVEQTQAEVHALRQQQWEQAQAQRAQQEQDMRVRQQQEAANWIRNQVTSSEAEFTKANPDYQEALNYARSRRFNELVAAGLPQEQAAQATVNDVNGLIVEWLRNGHNPAEKAYALAKAMGYTKQEVSDEQRAQMQEAGARAAKPSGGGAGKGKVSAAAIAQMTPSQLARLSDEDFKAAMA